MREPERVAGSASPWSGSIAIALIAIVIAGTVALLYGPALSLTLTGDSYQWIQHAHLAAHRPALLLADLDTFYRPSTTWTLVADRLVWGGYDATGYRTTSLALHGIVALALAVAGRRLGLGWISAAAVGVVWLTSPFTDESAFVVAYRFQPLLLLSWLVLIATWPHNGESWSRRRIVLAAAALLAAAAAKETWVVTPVLVAALEYERSRSWRAILTPAIMVGFAVALYLIFYFVAFPTSKSYFELGPHIAAKVPSQLAAFFYLEESVPDGLSLTWKGVVAAVMFMALVAGCVKWRIPGTLVAIVLFVVPTVPTMLVPYMPQRYLSIPYAGFVLVVALWMTGVSIRYPRWQVAIRGGCAAAAALVIVIGAATVRADLDDHRMMAGAHERLLSEAFDLRASVLEGAPVAVVRDEQTTPLVEIAQSTVGYPKLFFVRPDDPYGLIDAAALFEWVVADEEIHVEHVDDWVHGCEGVSGRLLAHRNGGFVDLGVEGDIATEASRWVSSGRGVRVIQTTQ